MIRFWLALSLLAVVGLAAEPVAPSPPLAHRVALVDIGYIFKHYKKFSALTASLSELVEQSDSAARTQLEQIRALQQQLVNSGLAPGSPEQKQLESRLAALQNSLQASRQVDQRDLLRKEAEIYKTAYLEVQDAVRKYARHYDYTLVLQFTRPDLNSADSSRDILEQLNNSVIYYSGRDDVTDPVLEYLNDNWTKHQGADRSKSVAEP